MTDETVSDHPDWVEPDYGKMLPKNTPSDRLDKQQVQLDRIEQKLDELLRTSAMLTRVVEKFGASPMAGPLMKMLKR